MLTLCESLFFSLAAIGCLLPATTALCDVGSYIAPDGTCKSCPAIFAQPQPNQTGCIPCPSNSLANEDGVAMCTTCSNGNIPTALLFETSDCRCPIGKQFIDDTQTCELCTTGTRWVRSRLRSILGLDPGECVSCRANEINTNVAENGLCTRCAVNEVSNKDGTACVECPKGQVGTVDGCLLCPPGTSAFGRDGSVGRECRACETGTFRSGNGGAACLPCPGNGFAMEGSSSCVMCDVGTAAMVDGTCGRCAPGTHYEESSFSCVECDSMQFMDVHNIRDSCYECSTTSFSEKSATECISCGPGQVGGNVAVLEDGVTRFETGCRNIECQRGQFFDPTLTTPGKCL